MLMPEEDRSVVTHVVTVSLFSTCLAQRFVLVRGVLSAEEERLPLGEKPNPPPTNNTKRISKRFIVSL